MRWMLVLMLAIGLWPMAAACQESQPQPQATEEPASEPSAPAAAANSEKAAAEPGPLDTILMRDKEGNLVPVSGLPFEEFEQLLRLQRGLAPAPPPAYLLQSLALTGQMEADAAEFEVTARILVREEGWVRVPLLMPTAALRAAAEYQGPGESLVTFDADAGGYVCWLKGKSEQPHEIRLRLAVRLATSPQERRLALRLPRATESSLTLVAPGASLAASLEAGEGILATRHKQESTELSVLGAGGDLELVWRPRSESRASGAQLEASGEIVVRVESQHRITSDARLRLRSGNGALERFVVHLPPGMELAPLPPAVGYSLASLGDESPSDAGGQAVQKVEVRLERPAALTGEIWLRAQLRSEAGMSGLAPGRFVVENAVRQRGTIDFVSEGEWQLAFGEEASVHRTDVLPEQAAAGVMARYEYFRQPCDLTLRVTPRPSRLSVEPTHMVFVDPQQARLESVLRCRFRGARAEGLRLNMEGWTFGRMTPDTLFDVPVLSNGQALFPFRAGVSPPAEIELKVEAHRRTGEGAQQLELGFPRPVASNVAPATIVVFAADNLELTPQASEMVGLSPDPTPIRVPGRQQPPLVYRDLGGGEPATFVASFRKLQRLTTVAARAEVRAEGQQLHIDQRLDYRVAHEPQRTFEVLAPLEVWTGGNLQVWLGDEPLAASARTEDESAAGLVRLQVSAPADQIGAVHLSVRYMAPFRFSRQEPTPLALPLVLPAGSGEQLTGQQIAFALPEGLQIEPDAEEFSEADGPDLQGGTGQVYHWPRPANFSSWVLRWTQGGQAAAIGVTQMWAQTWLSPRIRQERIAVRINTQRENVLVRIDKGVKQSTVQTAVDGQIVAHSFRQPGALIAAIPPQARGRECVLELSYSVEPRQNWWGWVQETWRPLHIEDAEPPRRVYWQLALPADEHLVLSPSDMTPEMAWSAAGWSPRQRPVLDQRQLEAWIKASPQEPLPRSANEYLFGALGRWPTVGVTVVHRRTLVIAVSGLVLMLGMGLIHVPALRRPEVGLVLGLLVAAGAVLAPEVALLVGQASLLGVVIVIGLGIWGRATSRRIPLRTAAGTSIRRPRESGLATSTHPPTPRERSSRVSSTAPGKAAMMEVRP